MGKRKHRRSKSTPGYINGWRRNSFDSDIEESSTKHDKEEEEGFSLPAIGIRGNVTKKKIDESESDAKGIVRIQNSTPESSQLGVNSVKFEEEGNYHPIFNPLSLSIPLPNSFSHSSSSSHNSSISLKLPSSNVSSASLSSTKQISEGVMDHKNGTDGSEDNDRQVTFPVSDFSPQGSFLGRVRSLMQSPPVQAMDRSGGEGYDPHRIPTSVFETNRGVEWSVASNESLFSLNLGRTNSMTPEHLFSSGGGGGNMSKSGELDPLAVYRLAAPHASTSVPDSEHWFQISDVEIDHVLKKIEEEHSEQLTSTEEKNGTPIADLERIISEVAVETNQKIQTESGEATFRHEDLKITSIKSEESVKSTNSFAFQVDGTKARDIKRILPIQTRQPEPDAQQAYKPKARLKSWFDCCSCSSCCLGWRWRPLCTCSFCSYSTCSRPCNCSCCMPSS